jgi:hypothetical protein
VNGYVTEALRTSDVGGRIEKIDARLGVLGAIGSPVDSKRVAILGNGETVEATCGEGEIAKGIRLNLGGTCNNHCAGDGRPVGSFSVICAKLGAISK